MSIATIEKLQRVVADETRPEVDRKTAAEHILKIQESDKEQAAPAERAEESNVKGIFDDLLDLDGAEERKRQEVEDQTMCVCAGCFFLQRKENATCKLCGESADCLVPSEARSNPEQEMFMRMAADYSVEQLKIALRSGWSHTPERQRVARLLLVSREARIQVKASVEIHEAAPRSGLDNIDLKKVESYYDYRLSQLQEERDRLEASTTSASAS